jgi:hypothetical protein
MLLTSPSLFWHTHTHAHTHARTCTSTRTRTHTHARTHTHTTDVHAHTHIHTHTPHIPQPHLWLVDQTRRVRHQVGGAWMSFRPVNHNSLSLHKIEPENWNGWSQMFLDLPITTTDLWVSVCADLQWGWGGKWEESECHSHLSITSPGHCEWQPIIISLKSSMQIAMKLQLGGVNSMEGEMCWLPIIGDHGGYGRYYGPCMIRCIHTYP